MREIKFRAKPNKAYFFESDNVPTTDGFVFGTPDTRMLNVPGAEKWRKEHEMVNQPSIVAMTRDGWPCSVAVQEETIGEFSGLQDKTGRDIYEGGATSMRATSCGGIKTRSCTWSYSAAACSTPASSLATLISTAVSHCGVCARMISTAPSSATATTIPNY